MPLRFHLSLFSTSIKSESFSCALCLEYRGVMMKKRSTEKSHKNIETLFSSSHILSSTRYGISKKIRRNRSECGWFYVNEISLPHPRHAFTLPLHPQWIGTLHVLRNVPTGFQRGEIVRINKYEFYSN